MTYYDNITVTDIINECLFDESGWHKELWYDKDTKKFNFSGWMTSNSWNETDDDSVVLVADFHSVDLTDNDTISSIDRFDDIDAEGLDEKTIAECENFYKVDYEEGYINPKFPLANNRDKILILDNDAYQYGIMCEKEAIEVLVNIAENDGWYEDELNHIEHVKESYVDEECDYCNE